MAISSFAFGLLAIAGLFRPAFLIAVLGLASLGWLRRAPRHRPADAAAVEPRSASPSRRAVAFYLAIALATAPALLIALYPPTAFDDTLYHLPVARGLIENAGAAFLPELRFPAFPFGQEVLMAVVLALGGGYLDVHLIATCQLALLAAVVWSWTRRLGGSGSSGSGSVALIAPALLVGCPLFIWLGGTAYVDLAVALYATAALWAFDLALGDRSGPPHAGAWAIAGGLAGTAAAVKYHGLYFVAALVAAAAVTMLRAAKRGPIDRRATAVGAAGLLLAAVTIASPWYMRNVVLTGNPMFPFLGAVFGRSEWAFPAAPLAGPRRFSLAEPVWPGWPGAARLLAGLAFDFVRAPFLLFAESVSPRAGVPPLSPIAAIALPIGAALAWLRRETRWLASIALLYLVMWQLNLRDVRFLAPATGLMAVLAAWSLPRWCDRWLTRLSARTCRLATGLALVALLFPAWAFVGHRIASRGLPLTRAARLAYLDAWSGYSALACAATPERPRPTVYGLQFEYLHYYAPGRFLGDWNGPFRYELVQPLLDDRAALTSALRAMGADFMLVQLGTLGTDGALAAAAPASGATPTQRPMRLVSACGNAELWTLSPEPPSPRPCPCGPA